MKEVRVRFAPAPTGNLHVGGARVALFNWAFARKNKGIFILRIEDTDIKRSDLKYAQQIKEALRWLSIDWDKEYNQSERLDIYKEYAEKLIEKKLAYYCYCTEEELEQLRKETKGAFVYPRICLNRRDIPTDRPAAVRIKTPDKKIEFEDYLRGEVSVNSWDFGDFVILKSNQSPTYNFACVVDDYLMGITHVIRGEDHISNTPKQIVIYQVFGWEVPKFIHLPLILGKDRKPLSKRHGAINILDYKNDGFLPGAIINYLALLSFSMPDGREIFSQREFVDSFCIERISKSPCVFDFEKLLWINSQHIRNLSFEELKEYAKDFINPSILDNKFFQLYKERVKTLKELGLYGDFLDKEKKLDYNKEEFKDILQINNLREFLSSVKEEFLKLPEFTKEKIEETVRAVARQKSIEAKYLIHSLRVAVSGSKIGPSLFELLELAGKELVIKRISDFCLEVPS